MRLCEIVVSRLLLTTSLLFQPTLVAFCLTVLDSGSEVSIIGRKYLNLLFQLENPLHFEWGHS